MKFSFLIRAAYPSSPSPRFGHPEKLYEASHGVNICDNIKLLINCTESVVLFIYNTLRYVKNYSNDLDYAVLIKMFSSLIT
jgi:hypothetical protein